MHHASLPTANAGLASELLQVFDDLLLRHDAQVDHFAACAT
jgi:hypothetical protein